MITAENARCLKYDGYNHNTLKWILDDLDKKVKEESYRGNTKTGGVYVTDSCIDKNKPLIVELNKLLKYYKYSIEYFGVTPSDCGSDTKIGITISW